MGPLVLLGLIGLAGYVVMILVVVMFVGGGLIMGAVMDNTGAVVPPEAVGGLFVGAGLIALLVILTIGLLMTMALFYGIPLVMLGGQDAWPAARDSVAACWVNVLPLLVFGLIYLVLAAVAVIPFGLGLLILGPVTVGAVYASYRDVFEETPTRVNLAK